MFHVFLGLCVSGKNPAGTVLDSTCSFVMNAFRFLQFLPTRNLSLDRSRCPEASESHAQGDQVGRDSAARSMLKTWFCDFDIQ